MIREQMQLVTSSVGPLLEVWCPVEEEKEEEQTKVTRVWINCDGAIGNDSADFLYFNNIVVAWREKQKSP